MLNETLPIAEDAVESFLETIKGEKLALDVEDPESVRHDELEPMFEGRFALLGRSGSSEPFVALLDKEWLPLLSEAMLGEELTEWNDDADDLMGEVANQVYASIRNRLSSEDIILDEADWTVVGDAASLPSELLGNEFEAIALSTDYDDEALTGRVLVPVSAAEGTADSGGAETQEARSGTTGDGPDPTGPEPLEETAHAGGGGQTETSPGPTPADQIDRSQHAEENEKVSVSSPSFPAFDEAGGGGDTSQGDLSSMELLGDVEIELSVELGRRDMPLQDILRLTNGSIVELDKLAGEPLQIYANNRLVAEGEAVVIDDQFGIRITRLASTEKRARALM